MIDKNKIFEIYMSIPFSINQLLNASTIYQGLEGYEARALVYQRALLSDNIENKLKLFFLLKDSFDKDKLNNIFKDKLSEILKEIDPNDIPEDLQKIISGKPLQLESKYYLTYQTILSILQLEKNNEYM